MKAHEKEAVQKNLIVVLGVARSGTSAIARGLKALGIDLGEKLTPPSKRWNPKGFFEDNDIVYKINRGVLYTLNSQWLSTNLIETEEFNTEALRDLQNAAVELIRKRMAATSYWGFKDPRTAKIMPFWKRVFAALNYKDSYVIALRNPLSSASSYQSLSGCDIERALLLWLMHLIPAIDNTQGKDRVVVSYELLMQDPYLQLNRVKTGLNIPHLADATELDLYAKEFLDKELHHYEYSLDDLKSHPATAFAPLCLKVYELLLKVAKDELKFTDSEFISTWQEIKIELIRLSPVYNYIDRLLNRNKQLERQIRTTSKSILWKMLYPLRVIDDALRIRRRNARDRKKRLISVYES